MSHRGGRARTPAVPAACYQRRMRILLVALALTLASPAAAAPLPSAGCSAANVEHGRRIETTLQVDGVARQVILDVPDSVKAKAPAPLLLDFHGFGHSGAGVWNVSGFKLLAEKAGFITAYPTGLPVTLNLRGQPMTGPGWEMYSIDGNRDLAFVRALLDDLERRYCLDRRRIYATGFSNGAFFSQLLACALAERIAAVAPVSGGALRVACEPKRPVPILIQHGSQDDLLPPETARAARDAWRTIDGCSGDPTRRDGPTCERWQCRDNTAVVYCEEAYAHRWPPQATERVWAFVSGYELP
jgi:polyhydroxybutyrate depolymerase